MREIANIFREAYILAENNSPDPSTRVGAIIETQQSMKRYQGVNQLTAGMPTISLLDRELKYKYIEHAERAAIFKAAMVGDSLLGATMYCPWAACCDCARAIILSGIQEVVCHGDALVKTPARWEEDIAIAKQMFEAAGVKYTWWYGFVGSCKNLFDGKYWYP
jgi:deoxycytidylate deaminase